MRTSNHKISRCAITYDATFRELGDNPFFRPFLYQLTGDDMAWKVKAGRFPKGMEIKFVTEAPDKSLVRFQRPHYFNADFIVQQFLGTGVGQMPKNFASTNASTIMQWAYIVTMNYRIERPDDEEFNPSNYSQWLDALYDGLKKRLAAD